MIECTHILAQALRQHNAVGPFGHDRDEIIESHPACPVVDANVTAKTGGSVRSQKSARLTSRRRAVRRHHRILEIEDHGVGAGLPGTAELALAVGRDEEKRTHSPPRRPAFHQTGPPTDCDSFPALVDALVLELDDAGVLARLATPLGSHDRSRPQRVTVKNWLGKPDFAHPQIGDGGSERRFADAHTDHQSERKDAVYQTLAKLRPLCELLVEMKRLRVHRQGAEQHIVHLANGAAHRVIEDLAFFKFLEIQSSHRLASSLAPAGSIPGATGNRTPPGNPARPGFRKNLACAPCRGRVCGPPSSICSWNQDGAGSGWEWTLIS